MLFERRCPACGRCARVVCDDCWSSLTPATGSGPGLFLYDQHCRSIVLAAKNHNRRDLFAPMGRALALELRTRLDPRLPWVVTWVPASRDGNRRRGYDQGRLLARSTASHLGLPPRRLLRRASGAAQTGRGRLQRLEGPAVDVRRRSAPDWVVLVDDVTTTGASLAVAARALVDGGARAVVPVAFAVVGDRPAAPMAAPADHSRSDGPIRCDRVP